MHYDDSKIILQTLENQVRQTKAAYYSGMNGVTYEDMAAAARRLLRMRISYERASGRKVSTKITKQAVASLLRSM